MREFNGPLTADDLEFLRARHATPYIDRQVELFGLAEDAENADSQPDDSSGSDGAGDGADGSQSGGEDLIGDPGAPFDVLGSTEAEVKEWAESASDEEKAAALSTEQGRDDRDPRKGVVSILS